MALPGAEQRLELPQADLLDYGSLVEVFMGCDGVFHTSAGSDLVPNYPVSSLSLSAHFINRSNVHQERQQLVYFSYCGAHTSPVFCLQVIY